MICQNFAAELRGVDSLYGANICKRCQPQLCRALAIGALFDRAALGQRTDLTFDIVVRRVELIRCYVDPKLSQLVEKSGFASENLRNRNSLPRKTGNVFNNIE